MPSSQRMVKYRNADRCSGNGLQDEIWILRKKHKCDQNTEIVGYKFE